MQALKKNSKTRPHLFGNLPKVVDEADGGRLLERVVDVVDVDLALVEEVVEDVDGLHSRWTLLLVAEDEVDPLVKVGRHVVALQGLKKTSVSICVSLTVLGVLSEISTHKHIYTHFFFSIK